MEFDNEIDALLRKARDDRGVLVGDTAKLHLDADEIAAFAENAVPETAKNTYIAHFADCEGCRKTLSSIILLNSEAGIETASVVSAPVVVESRIPWYRKLFLFPNLAYVMGSLVLLFSGFLAISILRNSGEKSVSSDVSQISSDEPAAGGPNLDYGESRSSANASNSMASSANTSANTMTNAASVAVNSANPRNPVFAANTAAGKSDSKDEVPAVTTDGIITGGAAPAAAPKPPPKDQPVTMADKNDLAKTEEQRKVAAQEVIKEKDELKLRSETAPSNAGGPFKAMKGPSRNERNDTKMRENDLRAKKSAKPEASMIAGRKQVSGKTFEFKQGVWYDSSYRGQLTTNIRRGIEEYKKLEGGLRSIAESFTGIVVVVWRDKAYRIQ